MQYKNIYVCLLYMLMTSCTVNGPQKTSDNDTTLIRDTPDVASNTYTEPAAMVDSSNNVSSAKTYSNERFKDVTVTKTGDKQYLIKGKGQIFEASFGWAIEDGHKELKTGFAQTDAGAPEWGNFSFTVALPEQQPNTTLHLLLFENSMKDGSRQHELPITLP